MNQQLIQAMLNILKKKDIRQLSCVFQGIGAAEHLEYAGTTNYMNT